MSKTEGFTYDPELGPGYFIQIRTDFVRYGGFTPAAKILYEVLLTYAGAKETAWPGQIRLGEHLGVDERTIRRVLKNELIPAGLVSVRRPGQGHPNTYHLHKLPLLPPKGQTGQIVRSRSSTPVRSRTSTPVRPRTARGSVEVQPGEIQSVEGEAEGSELTYLDAEVMRRAGLSAAEYRALRGQR